MWGDQCVTDCVPQGVVKCVRSPSDDNRHAVRILEEGNRKEMICAVDKKKTSVIKRGVICKSYHVVRSGHASGINVS